MINTKDLEKIVALSLFSAHVRGEKAVSVLLISDRPESGRSTILTKFYGNMGIAFLSDATAYALWRDFHKEIASGGLKHLVIPEFLAPLSRKSETVKSFIATLQMLIEEGIMEIHTGFLDAIKLEAPAALGLIACMPRSEFLSRRAEWELSGFLSRLVVVSYKYDNKTVDAIFDSIAEREYMAEARIKLQFPDKPVDIDIPPLIAQSAKEFVIAQTEKLRRTNRGYGFRELKHILSLLCANVIMGNAQNGGNRVSVTMADLEEIKRLSYLINEEFNPLRTPEDTRVRESLNGKIVEAESGVEVGVHQKEIYYCGFCKMPFVSAKALIDHWLRKHKEARQGSFIHDTGAGITIDGHTEGAEKLNPEIFVAIEGIFKPKKGTAKGKKKGISNEA